VLETTCKKGKAVLGGGEKKGISIGPRRRETDSADRRRPTKVGKRPGLSKEGVWLNQMVGGGGRG